MAEAASAAWIRARRRPRRGATEHADGRMEPSCHFCRCVSWTRRSGTGPRAGPRDTQPTRGRRQPRPSRALAHRSRSRVGHHRARDRCREHRCHVRRERRCHVRRERPRSSSSRFVRDRSRSIAHRSRSFAIGRAPITSDPSDERSTGRATDCESRSLRRSARPDFSLTTAPPRLPAPDGSPPPSATGRRPAAGGSFPDTLRLRSFDRRTGQ